MPNVANVLAVLLSVVVVAAVVVAAVVVIATRNRGARSARDADTHGSPSRPAPTPDREPTPTRMAVPHPDTPTPVSDDPTRMPAGWYPVLGGGKRYWDGERWTDHHAA